MRKAILIIGNPIDGWEFVGPFETEQDAANHPATKAEGWTWWIAELKDPAESVEEAKREDV